MSGAAHTPGPWQDNLHHEKRDGGRFLTHVTATGLVPIACVPTGVEGFGRDEGRANARLIAAAPELYEALTEMVMAAEGAGLDAKTRRKNALAQGLAALAKARGEQP